MVLAVYVQTLTGFAFGLLLMGAIASTGLMPLLRTAIVIILEPLAKRRCHTGKRMARYRRKPLLLSLADAFSLVVAGCTRRGRVGRDLHQSRWLI